MEHLLTQMPCMGFSKCSESAEVKFLADMPEGVNVANKTGELDTVEDDAGIVYNTAKGIDLVICFMSENLSDTGNAQAVIAQDSRTILMAIIMNKKEAGRVRPLPSFLSLSSVSTFPKYLQIPPAWTVRQKAHQKKTFIRIDNINLTRTASVQHLPQQIPSRK